MMNDVFERTWGERAGPRPTDDYWPTVIPAIKTRRAGFVFLAEAYWDLEFALQQQGFDYCYDKRLYDRLEHEGAESVRGHLTADLGYQERLVRFIENHDEPRAAATFPPGKARAAAVTALSLTGARLVHEGSSRAAASGCRSSSPGGRTRSPIRSYAPSTSGCSARSTTRSSATATGNWASGTVSPGRRPD
jgi:hypothetical protein